MASLHILVIACIGYSCAAVRKQSCERHDARVMPEQASPSQCCCKVSSESKPMKTYEAIHGDFWRSMHFYAEKDKSEKIGPIAKGTKVWALNDNPEAEGWIELAYVKKGNVGTGWSKFRDYRFKPLGTEHVKETECSITPTCGDSDLLVPGDGDGTYCALLSGMPVPVGQEIQWRDDAIELMQQTREFYIERHQKMTGELPEQLKAQSVLLESSIKNLEDSGYCLMWPPWCAIKHIKLNWEWGTLKSITKQMVKMVAGRDKASPEFQDNINELMRVAEYKEIAEKASDLERKLVEALFKVFDGSMIGQTAAWAAVKASSTQLKAFCSGKPYYDNMIYSWESPEWWTNMFSMCKGSRLSPNEKAELEAEAGEALTAIDHMQGNSRIRTIVASDRGVSLVQTEGTQATAPSTEATASSSFVEEQEESQDGGDAIVVFFLLIAMGCSGSTAAIGALLVL